MTSLRSEVCPTANPPNSKNKRVAAIYLLTGFGNGQVTGASPGTRSSLMMMLGLGLLLQRLAAKKVLFLLLFAKVFGALGVVAFHFEAFLGGEVFCCARVEWPRKAARVAGQCGFQSRRRGARTKAVM